MLIDGKREIRTFNCKDDIWDVIDLIIEETKEVNEEQGKDFDIAESVISQISFFACPNVLLDNKIYKDIQRYLYCEKFGIPPYKGTYGEQPFKWVNRSFAIKSAIAKKENREINNARKNNNTI